MTALAARNQTLQLINALPDNKIQLVLTFVQKISQQRTKVVAVQKDNILRAVNNLSFKDFEDALQFECADEVTVDYIITRNKQDFAETKIPLVTPQELLALLSKNKA